MKQILRVMNDDGSHQDAKYTTGDFVQKIGGDYSFGGEVVSVFTKKSGVIRYVVEDERGLLFIFNESQLSLKGIKI